MFSDICCYLMIDTADDQTLKRVALIESSDWKALASWCRGEDDGDRYAMLNNLLNRQLPLEMRAGPTGLLWDECNTVDWSSIPPEASNGFAALKLVIEQAVDERAGLAFKED